MFIDTHAHIYSSDFEEDLHEMITRASGVGVTDIYMPNIDKHSIDKMLSISKLYPNCHAMIGLHPCHVKADYLEELAIVEQQASMHNYIAIGEIGIDLYWDKTYVKEQEHAFKIQIELAKNKRLPIIIHSRDSLDLTIQIVSEMQDGLLRGIFHCFNGSLEQGQKIIELGFYLGIGGVITYKNAGVDKVVGQLPLENMVLETDAPYLSPVPFRGKRNECSYIKSIAEKLAEIKNEKIEQIASQTTFNANNIFHRTP